MNDNADWFAFRMNCYLSHAEVIVDSLQAKNRRNNLVIGWGIITLGILVSAGCGIQVIREHFDFQSWRVIRLGFCGLALVICGASLLRSGKES